MVIFKNILYQTRKVLFTSKENLKELFSFRVGDLLSIRFVRLEQDREVEMTFVGICISKDFHCFTVRNVVSGVVVENNFSFESPLLKSVTILKFNTKLLKASRAKFSAIDSNVTKFNFSFSMKNFLISNNPLKAFLSVNSLNTSKAYFLF